jgi:hypothetical protein
MIQGGAPSREGRPARVQVLLSVVRPPAGRKLQLGHWLAARLAQTRVR